MPFPLTLTLEHSKFIPSSEAFFHQDSACAILFEMTNLNFSKNWSTSLKNKNVNKIIGMLLLANTFDFCKLKDFRPYRKRSCQKEL